jgi:hypothetical protein
MHQDHEVQMARKECYHAAEHAIAIHRLLRNLSETTGLEGWVSGKITLANDYLNTVREHLEYNLLQGNTDILSDKLEAIAIAEGKKCNHTAEGTECPVHGLAECGTIYQESSAARPDYLDFDDDGNEDESMNKALQDKKKVTKENHHYEVDQAQSIADKLTTDKNLAKLNAMAHDSTIYRALDRYFAKHNIPETIYNRVAAIVFKKLRDSGRRLTTEPTLQEQGVAEGYKFKGGFPFDVDHMPGAVHKHGDKPANPSSKKFFHDKAEWQKAVNDFNSSVFDDNSEFVSGHGVDEVRMHDSAWAKWSDKQNRGYIDMGSMSEGVAEGSVNDYFKRRKDEENRIAGTKPPAKRNPQQTDYAKRRAQEKNLKETSAGSVAGVVNPPGKNSGKKKSQIGSLFGGTYNQSVHETDFAGEKTTPPQRPGDQVRGKEKAIRKNGKTAFLHRLVGDE